MKYFRHHIRSVIASPKGAAIQRVIAPARRSFSEGGRLTAVAILLVALVATLFLRSAHASYITTATTAGNIGIGTNHLVGDV